MAGTNEDESKVQANKGLLKAKSKGNRKATHFCSIDQSSRGKVQKIGIILDQILLAIFVSSDTKRYIMPKVVRFSYCLSKFSLVPFGGLF